MFVFFIQKEERLDLTKPDANHYAKVYYSKGDIAPLDCLGSLFVGRGKCERYALRTRTESRVSERQKS